jgi:hypothetical protein
LTFSDFSTIFYDFPYFIQSKQEKKNRNHSTVTAMRDPAASDTEQGTAR